MNRKLHGGTVYVPNEASRKTLERRGARHFQTDAFKLKGENRMLEYMILEGEYIAIWRRNLDNDKYKLHSFADMLERYLPPIKPDSHRR